MRIRKVAEPFKHIAANTVKCISIGEAIAEFQPSGAVISLDQKRQQKQMEMEINELASGTHRK
ncbi:hypothetical protein [Aliiglaciecola litoralis]|uniref:Uncharacterized protein n=1 Tax=Aliiglaciecola litoralis TaxID=582857 RepID=A0ABN1LF79_9ALTE